MPSAWPGQVLHTEDFNSICSSMFLAVHSGTCSHSFLPFLVIPTCSICLGAKEFSRCYALSVLDGVSRHVGRNQVSLICGGRFQRHSIFLQCYSDSHQYCV